MDRKSETKMAQSQRNFQSDGILRNKKKLQLLKEPIKKSSIKNSHLLNETDEQSIPDSKEILDLTPLKPEISNITQNLENHAPLINKENSKNNKKNEEEQEEKVLIANKTNQNSKIEPILKQKMAAKCIPPKNLINNINKKENNDCSITQNKRTDESDNQLINNIETNVKLQEISPLRFNLNNDALDFKKNASKFEEYMDLYLRDLKEHIKMITIKTFIVYIF